MRASLVDNNVSASTGLGSTVATNHKTVLFKNFKLIFVLQELILIDVNFYKQIKLFFICLVNDKCVNIFD